MWRRGFQRALCPRCDLWELVSRIMYIIDFIICIAKRMPRNSKTAWQRRELVQLYLSYNKNIMSQLLHTPPISVTVLPRGVDRLSLPSLIK